MKLLDTPQWDGLNTAQKRFIGVVYGNDGPLTTVLSPGAQRLVEGLEELGLIKVTRRERDVTIELNPEGWRHP